MAEPVVPVEGAPGQWAAVAFGAGIATAVMLLAIVGPGAPARWRITPSSRRRRSH